MSQTIEHSSQKIFISTLGEHTANSTEYNTNIIVSIPPIIIPQNDDHVPIIGIESLVLPLSYQMINIDNNILKLNSVVYTIPSGNYTITTLMEILNLFDVGVLIFTYNVDTNQLSLKVVGAPTTYTIQTGTTCDRVLGCLVTNLPVASETVFPSIVNLATNTSVLVQIANINTKNYDNITGANNIISKIPINSQPNQVLNYFNNQPFYSTITNKTLQLLNIVLLTDNHKPLRLFGNPDWAITVRIDYIQKEAKRLNPTAIQQMRHKN